MSRILNVLVAALLCATCVLASCYDPSPAFPPAASKVLAENKDFWTSLDHIINHILVGERYNTSSFSVEVTTSGRTLWTHYHTASILNESIGVREVDGNSRFRIASVTKTFTVLALLHQVDAGKLRLDDPVKEYIEEFQGPQNGSIPWKDITLRSLASQLSGIPRELSLSETGLHDPAKYGLPPTPSHPDVPLCDTYTPGFPNRIVPCTRKDLLHRLKSVPPLFAPNQKSTYSNVAFELLGLVLENATGTSYEKLIRQSVLDPIFMLNTSVTTPQESVMAIPAVKNWWSNDLGVQAPTGAIYSSSSDLSRYLRYILTHYNSLAGINWLQGASWSADESSFYGMPWEIFRTSKILHPITRPTTFISKSGSLPGYFSQIILIPDYDLGVTILVAGDQKLLAEVKEAVTVRLVRAVDIAVAKDINKRYSGTYVPKNKSLNTTLSMTASPETGLTLTSFISNSTDVLTTLNRQLMQEFDPASLPRSAWRAQLTPTLLYKNESKQEGELWRVVTVRNTSSKEDGEILAESDPTEDVSERELLKHVDQEDAARYRCEVHECNKLFKGLPYWKRHVERRHAEWYNELKMEFNSLHDEHHPPESTHHHHRRERGADPEDRIWDDVCITDVDNAMYLGVPVNELVFYFDDTGKVDQIGLSAFNVTLVRQKEVGEKSSGIVVGAEETGSAQIVL